MHGAQIVTAPGIGAVAGQRVITDSAFIVRGDAGSGKIHEARVGAADHIAQFAAIPVQGDSQSQINRDPVAIFI